MTKAQIQFIQSLSRQKYRKQHNAYLVEGDKNAKEWLLSALPVQMIVATEQWLSLHGHLTDLHPNATKIVAKAYELEKVSTLHTAQQVLLVVTQATPQPYKPGTGWMLLLEQIQDPGNMGTIIRTADWFGIDTVLCSEDCVEVYNPKVVQASMGSLLRINICEVHVPTLLQEHQPIIYATCLEGRPLHDFSNTPPGIIAMGNESRGLSQELLKAAIHKITIPGKGGAESLNVAVATGIVCAQLILK